jgi:hypothetical protein
MHEEREFVETHLAALVDGAPLEPELRQRLERLIAENPLYRRWYEQQRAVRQLLRERAAALRYPVPARLSVRVWRKLLWRQFGGIRRWAPVLAPVAVAAALVVGYLLVQSPSSRSAPMCFATALQTAFRQLQQGQLLITPVTDTAAVQQFFRRHGVSYTVLLPYMEHTVQLVSRRVERGKFPAAEGRLPRRRGLDSAVGSSAGGVPCAPVVVGFAALERCATAAMELATL